MSTPLNPYLRALAGDISTKNVSATFIQGVGNVAIVGPGGVKITQSTLQGAGLGLFADKRFGKNDVITEYCGDVIDYNKAMEMRRLGIDSHVKGIEYMSSFIDGVRCWSTCVGKGGASFANDGTSSKLNNCTYYKFYDNTRATYRVFLKATRDIAIGEELFVCYGNGYWKQRRLLQI